MTALDMYKEDRKLRRGAGGRTGRQEYFLSLRDSLHDELMREGRSDFLEAMIAECAAGKSLRALEYAALQECFAMIVDGRDMQDATQRVPHILKEGDEPLTWQELESGPAFCVVDPDTLEMLRRLRTVSNQMVSFRDETLEPQPSRAAQRDIDSLMALRRLLEADNAALRKERDELRARVTELEEGVISQQLQMKLEVRRRQAETQLEQEIVLRRQQAEETLRQSLVAMATQEQQARIAAERLASAQADSRMAQQALLQSELQAQLEELQRQLDARMSGWMNRLRGEDYRFLAMSYVEMERAVHGVLPGLSAEAAMHGANEALRGTLRELCVQMEWQLRRMEQALGQLGLRVFRPEAGEPFDSRLHSLASASAEDAPEDAAEVAALQTAGVIIGGDEGEVLVRAVVQVRPRTEKNMKQ